MLNAAIDKYVYVVVKQRFDDDIYVNYSQKEIVSRVEDLQHDLVREAMHMAGVRQRRRDHHAGRHPVRRAPASARRRRSRSACCRRCSPTRAIQLSAEELAERACAIEIERCGKPIGKQDQYAAAYGGICDLRFGPGDRVTWTRSGSTPPLHRQLQDELMLFYTGITRSADTILEEQTANIADRLPQLGLLRDLAGGAADAAARRATPTRSASRRTRAGRPSGSWPPGSRTRRSTRPSTPRWTQAQPAPRWPAPAVAGSCWSSARSSTSGGAGAAAEMKELPIKIDPYGSRVVFNVHRDIWG